MIIIYILFMIRTIRFDNLADIDLMEALSI